MFTQCLHLWTWLRCLNDKLCFPVKPFLLCFCSFCLMDLWSKPNLQSPRAFGATKNEVACECTYELSICGHWCPGGHWGTDGVENHCNLTPCGLISGWELLNVDLATVIHNTVTQPLNATGGLTEESRKWPSYQCVHTVGWFCSHKPENRTNKQWHKNNTFCC